MLQEPEQEYRCPFSGDLEDDCYCDSCVALEFELDEDEGWD